MAMTVDKQEILDLIRVQSPRLELISFDAGKSEAWRWFKRVRVDGRVLPYAVCNGCLKPVHYTPRDGTGGLRRHACALTMAMQSQNLAASTHKTGPGTQVLTSTPANGSQRQRGGGGGSTTSLSDVTRNLVASRKNNHNLGRDLSNSYRHQLETAQQSHNAALPPAKRARPSKNNRTLANTNPGLVAPSLMLWAAQQGLVDLASTASLANMDLRALLPVSSIASMASMASTMASLNAKYSAVMASNGGSSPSPNWAADEGSQRESKSSAGKSRHESGGGSSSPNERTLHGHGNGSNSCSSTPSTTPVPSGGNPSSFNGMNVPKSMSKISDIALDLAQKVNAESTTPMNLSQDYMASLVPMRRPRKRSHPDRAVPSALPSSSPPAVMSLANGNYTTVQVPPHHSYSTVCTENGDELNRERLAGEDLSRASLLRLSLEAKRREERQGNVEENEPVNEASVEDYEEEEEDEQKQPLDLQQVIPRRSSDVKVETQVPVPTQQSSSLSNLGALNHAQLSPPLRTVHMNQISVLTDAIDTLLPVPHDKIKREVSTTPMKCESLAINQPLLCQEATLSTSSSYALNELLGQLSHLIQRHKELLSTLEPSEPEVTMPVIPEIQKPAPQFRGIAVVDGQFKEISLADYAGKYVILFFYPLDFTFVCPTEIIAFSDRAEEFRQIGCEVIACSTDSHFSHLAWVNTPRKQGGLGSMNIPLLADKATVVSKAYGVYKEDEGLTFRGLFIIDDKQRLRQITINDLPVGRSVDETLRLVQAFQFTDKHGEVCPAGWKPGSKTMKADPSGSKEYFEGQH